MRPVKVTFFVPDISNIKDLSGLDPDRDWRVLKNGREWVLQTYLRLHRSGYPVELSNTVPDDGFVVFHPLHKSILREALPRRNRVVLVSTRGDCRVAMEADFEILQNGYWSDEKKRFFIPYWPQPSIIPRNPERKSSVKTISFKGYDANVHSYFLDTEWLEWMNTNQIQWRHDSTSFEFTEKSPVPVDWHDYAGVDVLVAVRPLPDRRKKLAPDYRNKPANKLYNAWRAGVPAVLGREYAYREQRRSALDYIELQKPEDAKEAVLKLKNNPNLYRDMVQNGFERAKEFTAEQIVEQWAEVLFDLIPRQMETFGMKMMQYCPRRIKMRLRKWSHRVSGRPRW